MSIYDNETSKIYPDLNPVASQEPGGVSIAAFSGGVGLPVWYCIK